MRGDDNDSGGQQYKSQRRLEVDGLNGKRTSG